MVIDDPDNQFFFLQILVTKFLVCPEDLLFIEHLPVDVNEGLAIHTVDVEDPI